MGAIGGEELVRWEKMQIGASADEEKIFVLVRLRPLSEKEIAKNEVSDWECINDTTILFRNSLQERSGFPSAYNFDRVFQGDCSTRYVYDEGAKEIALSVVGGINSTIFAYGQTSSGKTYTMIGITEYTVADIYAYMKRHEERAFVLKFSAMEIYNESVRDLLSTDSTPLRILDDPEKGTIVEKLTEETLRDWSHLKELLSICEAQRQTGETSLNETSSRSHQILRLTIESSAREFLGKDKSTTLSASVNFVDLAGSERASQALSVGARLKEGCHINRSLLTLGTVIRKLSKGRQGHINYRDSKLTRILQPSLGGNARTAIICTLSPARSHVEQSRNTLLFASCAKEVTTNAHVNVVMSDKALVKHLQKELARLESELRSPAPTSLTCDYGALLRKKDIQIERMEKEIKELTKQRDLAESRVEDLLRLIETDQAPRQRVNDSCDPTWQVGNTCEDECSASSGVINANCMDVSVQKFKYFGKDSGSIGEHYQQQHPESSEDLSDVTSSVPNGNLENHAPENIDDPDDLYKDVQCIEIEESSKGQTFNLLALPTGENEGQALTTSVNREQKVQDVQKATGSLESPFPNGPSPWALERDISSCESMKLKRSQSCGTNGITGSSSPCSEKAQENGKTPINGFEKSFPGRPEGFQRRFPLLKCRANFGTVFGNDSDSSVGSALVDVLHAQDEKHSGDEDITSIHTFVAGLKEMAELRYEKQIDDEKVQKAGVKADDSGKNVKDVGLDPMQDSLEVSTDWPLEFERQQRAIVELWQTCSVPLVHRTYFFLLFKGDPADSIYMEVEIRRLSFLKGSFSRGHHAGEDRRTPMLVSSMRTLRREKETLCKLIRKRFSKGERERLYQRWGIGLDTKRRRLQLVQRLWRDTNDPNHIKESAAIVAKLVKFSDQERALKETFGLSFAPPCLRRRSFRWKHGMTPLS